MVMQDQTYILIRIFIWFLTHRIILEIYGRPFGLLFHHASCGKRHLVFLGCYVTLIRCVWVFLFPIRVSVAVCLDNDNLKDDKNNWNSVFNFWKWLTTILSFSNFMNRNKNNTQFINWDTFTKTDLPLLLGFHLPYAWVMAFCLNSS